jgi:hypothetical protein
VLALVAGFSFVLRNSQNGVTGGPTASVSPTATSATPSESPTASVTPGATSNAVGFTTAGATVGWTGFSFSQLPAGSPLLIADGVSGSGVGQVLRWKGGYVATGSVSQFGQTGPSRAVWTSPDGGTWTDNLTPLVSTYPAAWLVSVAPAGLVAIEVTPERPYKPSVVWTTSDGVIWRGAGTANLPGGLISIAGTDKAIVATVEVSTGTGKSAKTTYQIEYSTDGVNWSPETVSQGLAAAAEALGLPPHVQTNDGHFYVMGTSGFMAKGWPKASSTRIVFASIETGDEMWLSDDGKTWTRSAGGYQLYADYIDFGRDGMVLHTNAMAAPGANFQAYSADGGKTWHDDPTFSPVGQSKCEGACGPGPDGVIGSNGTIFVAVKNGGQEAWLSYDGHTWQAVTWAGGNPEYPVPGAGASYGGTGFVVFPRGVLLNGTYGAAK